MMPIHMVGIGVGLPTIEMFLVQAGLINLQQSMEEYPVA